MTNHMRYFGICHARQQVLTSLMISYFEEIKHTCLREIFDSVYNHTPTHENDGRSAADGGSSC